MPQNNFPKLHNAMWPGLVGKGSPGAEPFIDLDTMLDMTAKAEVGGVKFDGVDLFLYNPHTDIDISDDGIQALADKIRGRGFVVGSVVAPVWFDASAMGDATKRANWLTHVRKAVHIAAQLRKLGVRPYGVVRIDFPRSRRGREGRRRASRRRGRDLLGRHAFVETHGESPRDGRHAEGRRLPGRHVAHTPLHPR
jgi:hypothetical protein